MNDIRKKFVRQRLDDVALYVGVLLIFGFLLNGVITLIKYIWK